jgi:dimethylargininase
MTGPDASSQRIALTREVSAAIGACELTFLDRQPIDPARARTQHRAYESFLSSRGWEVRQLSGEAGLPDCVFIEDTAVVLDELAILAWPGAASRRAELAAVEQALRPLRPLARIKPPGLLDGGDVLQVGRRLYVGLSQRTNARAIEQLRRLSEPLGYQTIPVPIRGCLHLKSAATAVGANSVLISRRYVDSDLFAGCELIDVDAAEPLGANVLLLDDVVLVDQAFPRTRERLESAGIRTAALDLSELAKAEGGLTCGVLLVA